VISALRKTGVAVTDVHAEVWRDEHKFALGPRVLPALARAEIALARRSTGDQDVLLVGYPGQFDLWAARRHRLPVAFNAMVSLYEALVEDRGRFRAGSLPGRALLELDRRSFRAADLVVSDTAANAAYMAELASLEDVAHVYVGAEDHLFAPAWEPPESFSVLFVGKLIPLHGLSLILEAAALVPDIPFTIVGTGQEQVLLRDAPPNVQRVDWIDYHDLPSAYAAAGCGLGIFGVGPKASRVIPNKIFQGLAVGTPMVTADTPAARELLTDSKDALLVDRTAEALAAAIRRLAEDTTLAQSIGGAGRETYEREASEQVLGKRWLELLLTLSSADRMGGRA
jgi:glycosyltransferase involved in cell wall biosynthesis